jgi:hypothetical protein
MIPHLATAGAGDLPSAPAGKGGPELRQQYRVRAAARPLVRFWQLARPRSLLPQGEYFIARRSENMTWFQAIVRDKL